MTTTPPPASPAPESPGPGPVLIRPCRPTDLELLERHMPSPGRTRRHAARFDRQEQGLSTFLTAWIDGVPVGSAQILWQGCAAPEVQARFPGCPELNGLGIWPPDLRSRGIGTALIRAAERRARDAGHDLIGLGVDDDNHRAAALYLRIGYRETGCRYLDRYAFLDADGVRREVADPARFLARSLGEASPGPE
ncbi:GNAT family N-acetyltransferase [Streptomyces sp. SID14515]|uniref:GNAT family N-acetyltransferase n=1 Tax=Streptomyces sp. SID14515 TaxID=2706074 RepID=UPI0013CCB0C8|nr:GNAT family N-acetyltransferase [Streptomyces sp. SID14515]NEB38963.1 GNAT family N-acetyltransferase [Streptomyces sp. SID14515]